MSAPVAIVMGSQSDWTTMRHAAETLDHLKIGYVSRIVSAHRTPDRLMKFAKGAQEAGFKVIIAGAGGAAHLPGMTAAMTALPVFGVPIETKALSGQDSLYSIVQMPAGIPVGTWPSARPAPSTRLCWQPPCWRFTTRAWRSGLPLGAPRRLPPSPNIPRDK